MSFAGGFTLIEALVAISILTIAVTGPLSLASKGLAYSSYAKDEITAFYLANEAIDVIRNIRDTNIKSGKGWLNVPGTSSIDIQVTDKCGGSNGCYFDVWKSPPDLRNAFSTGAEQTTLKTCNSQGLIRFGYNFDWPYSIGSTECESTRLDQTDFSRKIYIVPVAYSGPEITEIRATVIVSWMTRTGIERNVTITENIFKLSNI